MTTSFLTEIIENPNFFKKFPTLRKYINKTELNNILANISTEYLYPSKFHGLYHSEKVAFFAYIIAKYYNLPPELQEIVLDAALYHDIGRTSDYEETTHGLVSARRMDFLKTKPIYSNNPLNLELVKTLADAHSLDDSLKQVIFDNHNLPEEKRAVFNTLYNILKDADALDRLRFDKTMKSILNEKFLRLPVSKKLINLSSYINKEYRRLIDFHNYTKIKDSLSGQEPRSFYHGIGFNIFAIPSILTNGLTSFYYDKDNKNHIHNYAGYNNNMWLSAVTTNEHAEGYQQFISNGIYFEFTSSDYNDGLSNKYIALDTGMPYRSNNYHDEVFIFEKVLPEQITNLALKEELFNTSFQEINLIKGNIAYEKVVERVKYYCEFLTSKKKTKYFTLFEPYLKSLFENTKNYESLNFYTQEATYKEFLNSQEALVSSINNLLVLLFLKEFQSIFHKKTITVGDVLIYVLNKSGINYTLNNEEGEIKIIFSNLKQSR